MCVQKSAPPLAFFTRKKAGWASSKRASGRADISRWFIHGGAFVKSFCNRESDQEIESGAVGPRTVCPTVVLRAGCKKSCQHRSELANFRLYTTTYALYYHEPDISAKLHLP